MDGKTIRAKSDTEFVVKLRKSSWFHEKSQQRYLDAFASRVGKFGFVVDTTSPNAFVASLVLVRLLSVRPAPARTSLSN